MLPSEDMARVLATRRLTEAEHGARDHGFRRDIRPAPDGATRRPAPTRRPDADCRPCPERAQGALG
jgi:hypothetical protein